MPKSKPHSHEINAFQIRGGKLWAAIYEGERDESGERNQIRRTGKTRKIAIAKVQAVLNEIAVNGGKPTDRRTRIADVARMYLELKETEAISPKGMREIRDNLNKYIVPLLGSKVATSLTKGGVSRFHTATQLKAMESKRSIDGYSTTLNAHKTLVALLNFAVDEGIVPRNVAEAKGRPKPPEGRAQRQKNRGSLTALEAARLRDEGGARWRLYVVSGGRSSEIRGLRWEYVDWDHDLIHLDWRAAEVEYAHACGPQRADGSWPCGKKTGFGCTAQDKDNPTFRLSTLLESERIAGRWFFMRPKGQRARPIIMTSELKRELLELQEATKSAHNPFGLVWPRDNGWPEENRDENEALREALRRLGIERPGVSVTLHWLRHSFVTLMKQAGVPWAAFGPVAGHADESTSDLYTHEDIEASREGVQKLNDMLTRTLREAASQ
ncbi:tyrosine-type recombinase/integrase [Gryllotalpicola protaetiae]|uniref:tyrosine-type recombinase/integrase n=1 Tax=Gryllotalpicola protaetiae TaxID=2419771 RepID=UPI0013C48CE4|nr:site-specific integrase [Gryllotalpicola protaetiae]